EVEAAGGDELVDPVGDRVALGHGQRAAGREVVLEVDDDQRLAHVPEASAPARAAGTRRGAASALGGAEARERELALDPRPAPLGAARDLLEPRDLALALDARRVVLRQAGDEVADAVADLEREVGGRGPDELVDVLDGGLAAQPRR